MQLQFEQLLAGRWLKQLRVLQDNLKLRSLKHLRYCDRIHRAKTIAGGQASVGREFSGEYGFVQTAMYWPLTHQVSPAEDALSCVSCHSADGVLDFAALGYSEERATTLTTFLGCSE